ncbi:metallophosphoesterase family protein [Flavobacterium sp.]|uniref:metallophosphoesterase family protein n=1 Tax=Flavobacterium sp. TaxID=239 RepID=UPI0012102D33|nr:metallophosphoesterase family protein [Flavobacterium sp.]RZJ71256.1 MAG: phosphoesterase [Flavobacterium sp.]
MESTLWFTSDHHFGHKNIIKFSNRPFADIDEMNSELIKRWNEKVKPEDIVYHLGDFGLASVPKVREILGELNGKIHLVTGNHESVALQCADCFESVKDYHELIIPDPEAHAGKRLIVLFHYAMRVWNASHHGSWHLYGHSHNELPDDRTSLSFDVGVDCHDFYPISYQEVKQIMSRKTWTSPFEPRN